MATAVIVLLGEARGLNQRINTLDAVQVAASKASVRSM